MNILIVTPFPVAKSMSGKYVKDIASFLTAKGNRVHVVNIDSVATEYNEPYTVETLLCNNDTVGFTFPCFTTHPHTETTFHQLLEAQINDYANFLRDHFSRIIEEFKPDIIHSQYLWISSAILAGISQVPVIATSFGNEIHALDEDARYAKAVNFAVEKSRYIVAPSKQIEMQLRARFDLDSIKLKLIYKGYDDDIYQFIEGKEEMYREYFAIPSSCKQAVLYADRLDYMKGIDLFLQAARTIISKREDICFIIVGSGDFLNDVKDAVEEYHGKILYFPSVTDEEKPLLYHISSICVMPVRFEQFGINALQSFAMGTPVVSSQYGELQHFVNSENGRTLAELDSEQLSASIEELLESNFKEKASFFCHQFAERNYSKSSSLKLIVKLYEYTLAE